jgi:hypothetical protein
MVVPNSIQFRPPPVRHIVHADEDVPLATADYVEPHRAKGITTQSEEFFKRANSVLDVYWKVLLCAPLLFLLFLGVCILAYYLPRVPVDTSGQQQPSHQAP